ncbi:MAG TPA: hypothetical protein VEI04_03240, partial [Syntrophobacteria bacterium]|nr:hypothetical protein [Syntrophobacteria bacterium]
LIPQDSRALHLELFTVPSTLTTFYETIKHQKRAGWPACWQLVQLNGSEATLPVCHLVANLQKR